MSFLLSLAFLVGDGAELSMVKGDPWFSVYGRSASTKIFCFGANDRLVARSTWSVYYVIRPDKKQSRHRLDFIGYTHVPWVLVFQLLPGKREPSNRRKKEMDAIPNATMVLSVTRPTIGSRRPDRPVEMVYLSINNARIGYATPT